MDDCLEEATNVYRTKHYIVEQVLGVDDNEVECAQLCSHDTFYRRTKKRDAEYEATGDVYECKVKPYRDSDKTLLNMLLR